MVYARLYNDETVYIPGLTHFVNPSDGPLQAVGYCPLDDMFHLHFRYSPFQNDHDLKKISFLTRKIVSNINERAPVNAVDIIAQNGYNLDQNPIIRNPDELNYRSFWFYTNLDRLPLQLNAIPPLQTKRWLSQVIADKVKKHPEWLSSPVSRRSSLRCTI